MSDRCIRLSGAAFETCETQNAPETLLDTFTDLIHSVAQNKQNRSILRDPTEFELVPTPDPEMNSPISFVLLAWHEIASDAKARGMTRPLDTSFVIGFDGEKIHLINEDGLQYPLDGPSAKYLYDAGRIAINYYLS